MTNLYWENENVKIYCGDSSQLELNEKYHLSISSPPYFVGKEYEDYLKTYEEYLQMLFSVYKKTAENLIDGGRMGINICDIATFSKVSGVVQEKMTIDKITDFLEKECGMFLVGRVIWSKDAPWVNSQQVQYNTKTKHTTYRFLSDWEYLWIFRKGENERNDKSIEDLRKKYITKDQWKEWVQSVWYFRSVYKNDDHPAKYPPELVARFVQMFSFPGDIVFDPFLGSGTTAYVSNLLSRKAIGCDLDEKYCELSKKNCINLPEVKDIEKLQEIIDRPIKTVIPNAHSIKGKSKPLF